MSVGTSDGALVGGVVGGSGRLKTVLFVSVTGEGVEGPIIEVVVGR